MGGSPGRGTRNYVREEYARQLQSLHSDPLMLEAQDRALGFLDETRPLERDAYGSVVGQQKLAADQQMSAVRAALASRGGGGIGQAIGLGGQIASQGAQSASVAGQQAEREQWVANLQRLIQGNQLLQNMFANKWGAISNLYGAQMGPMSASISGAAMKDSAKIRAMAQVTAQTIQSLGGVKESQIAAGAGG